jgi:hypothetical protein
MSIPPSATGERVRSAGLFTTMNLLAAALLMELLAWIALRAGLGMKVGVGVVLWLPIAVVTVGSFVLWSIVRAIVRRRFRFGMKELLAGTLLIGAGLGAVMNLLEFTRDQRVAAARLSGLGAAIAYGGTDGPSFETLIGREYFRSVTAVYGHDSRISDADLAILERLRDLDVLTLGGPQITDHSLSFLKGHTSLRQLALFGANVSGAGLAQLDGFTHLEGLELHGCPITNKGLAQLVRFPNLRALNLNRTATGDAGLAEVARVANLGCLYLDGTRVTDSGMSHITGLTKLRELSLAGTQVTDRGLEQLKALTALRRLRLERSLVTDAGVSEMRKARSSLVISR